MLIFGNVGNHSLSENIHKKETKILYGMIKCHISEHLQFKSLKSFTTQLLWSHFYAGFTYHSNGLNKRKA